MDPKQLISIKPLVDTAMFMLIWLVQLIIYPAFGSIDTGRFKSWHQRYMRTMTVIVGPLIISQGLLAGVQCLTDLNLRHGIGIAALLLALGTTAALSVPCHNRLQQQGNRPALTARLVRTNWIRTAAWSVVWLTGL